MTNSVGNHVEEHAQGFSKIINYSGGLYLTVSYGPLNSTQFRKRISTKKSRAKTFTNWFCHTISITKWGCSPTLPLVFYGAYLHKTMKNMFSSSTFQIFKTHFKASSNVGKFVLLYNLDQRYLMRWGESNLKWASDKIEKKGKLERLLILWHMSSQQDDIRVIKKIQQKQDV